MEPIKPIPPKTLGLAARGIEREVAKINATVELAKRSGFMEMMEQLISRLARL